MILINLSARAGGVFTTFCVQLLLLFYITSLIGLTHV